MIVKLAMKHLFSKPLSCFLTLMAVVSALSLLGSFWTVVENLERKQIPVVEGERGSLSLFVDPKLSEAQVAELKDRLHKDKRIAKVTVLSAADTMKNLGEKLGQLEEKLTQVFTDKSLSWTFRLKLEKNVFKGDEWKSLLNSLRAMPGVLDVDEGRDLAPQQHSTAQKRVFNWANVLFGTVFLLVALLVSHLIRLAFEGSRSEIETMKVLGAPKTWMFMPLLLEGLFFGVVGSVAALLLLSLGVYVVLPKFATLLLAPGFEFSALSTASVLRLLAFGIGSSLTGALFTWPLISSSPKEI